MSRISNYSGLTTQDSGLILLIGLPGSGKSTLAKQLMAKCPQMQLISTDAIRGQLFGDEAIQGPWMLIEREIQRQLQLAIASGKTAIYDATNAQRRHRRQVIASARDLGFTHITGVWVDTPVWLCLARNKRRVRPLGSKLREAFPQASRQVPEEIIFRMHRQLRDAPPTVAEGLDCLIRFLEWRQYGNCSHVESENPT